MGAGRAHRSLFPLPFSTILVFASTLFSGSPWNRPYGLLDSPSAQARTVRLPDPVPGERVFVFGKALRPVAYRLGYADFISQIDSIARLSRSGITAADLASMPYPQSDYDRLPLRPEMLARLRLPRPTLERLGIRIEGWIPQPGDFNGIPASQLKFMDDTSKAMDFVIEARYLDDIVEAFHDSSRVIRLIYQGPPTLRELGNAGIPLAALDFLPINAIDVAQLELRPEEALAMGALPPSARQIHLAFGDLRRIGLTLRQMSALELDRKDLTGFCEAATGRTPIDSGSRISTGMFLNRFLDEAKESSPTLRQFLEIHRAHDSLHIDTLGFAYLFFRNDSVYLQPQAGEETGYRILFPSSAYNRNSGLADQMADFGTLPTFRLGFGYPEMVFAQAGLALTQLPFFSRAFLLLGGIPYLACQAGLTGYEGILGITEINFGGGHSPPFFIAYGAAYRREWRDPVAWNAGPVLQLGLVNLGIQAAIRFGHETGGEAAILLHLFPL